MPSIALVIAGDAIYNGTHPYLVESNHEGLLAWLAAIDKIEALKPQAVVVGHGPLDPDNAPRHIEETRRYIRDFMRLDAETTTARELYDSMLALYPESHKSRITLGQRQRGKGAHDSVKRSSISNRSELVRVPDILATTATPM